MHDRIPLFGAFLREENALYEEYNEKFKARLKEVEREAKNFLRVIGDDYPSLKHYLGINHSNIFVAISRYFNDAIRLRTMHNITGVHRTKIAAYTAKWIWLNPVITATISFDEYLALGEEAQAVILNVNYLFIEDIVRYFIPVENVADVTHLDRTLHRFMYLMKVGVFEEHAAAALLESIDPIDGTAAV